MICINDPIGNPITAKSSMKILGFKLNARASSESHLSKVKSKIGMELAKLKPMLKFMTLNDRKVILNSKLRSIIDYGLPLFMGKNEAVITKVEATYMSINRIIHGGLMLMTNKEKNCKSIKVDLP